MGSNLLSISSSALAASQAALNTAGNNIANVNTSGYSRQSVILANKPGQFSGTGFYGQGVDVTTVIRIYNDFQNRQLALATAISSADAVRADKLGQLEQVFPGGDAGLGKATNDLLNAFSDVSQNPADLSARSVVLARADELASRFRTTSSRLDDIQLGLTQQMAGDVSSVNNLAHGIAALNQRIANEVGSGHTPNDLLDQRDQMIRDLNKYVQTATIPAADGSLTVMIAGGQPLVLGGASSPLFLKTDVLDPSRQILCMNQVGQTVPLDHASLAGGEMAGLLKFQNVDLQQGKDNLWKMALTVGDTMNKQHSLGLDLTGTAGGNFFNLIPVVPAVANTGTANLDVSLYSATGNANPTALVRSDYLETIAAYNAGTGAGTVNIKRLSDGTTLAGGPFAFSNSPGVVTPVIQDGLVFQITNGATLVAGDAFTVRQSTAAGSITAAITTPAKLAMGNPVVATPTAANLGSLAIVNLHAAQANPSLSATVTLTFDGVGGFTVAGAVPAVVGTVSYFPDQPISYNGWSLTLKGTPSAGDTMTVQANDATIVVPGGPTIAGPLKNDGGNAMAVLNLRDTVAPLFGGNPISDIFASILSDIGISTQSGKIAAETSNSLVMEAKQSLSSISGVNLDEEAAKLIQYQQSYQASGKLLQVAQTVFDALLQTMR